MACHTARHGSRIGGLLKDLDRVQLPVLRAEIDRLRIPVRRYQSTCARCRLGAYMVSLSVTRSTARDKEEVHV